MKNAHIEFWRIAFAIYMVVYHTLGHVYGIATGGYIGVDVFAVIAGFFLASSHEKRKLGKSAGVIPYIAGRFARLWPVYIFAYLISAITLPLRTDLSFMQAVERVYRSFPEMFMLKINVSINGVAWYMGAMLLASVLLWVLLTLDPQRKWAPGLLLIAALLIYTMFLQEQGRIHFTGGSQQVVPFWYDGVWRVFADMGMGVFAFSLIQDMPQKPRAEIARRALCITGNIGFALVLCVSLFKYHGFCDFWFIFITWCAVVCLKLSERPSEKEPRASEMICYLSGLSYPVYLLHEAVFALFKTYGWIASPALGCAAVIGISVSEAALLSWLLKKIKEKLPGIW